jgi:hypothetical protein
MVPVYSHRYLPAGRGTYGQPVLSMHQTDIIFYGTVVSHGTGLEGEAVQPSCGAFPSG